MLAQSLAVSMHFRFATIRSMAALSRRRAASPVSPEVRFCDVVRVRVTTGMGAHCRPSGSGPGADSPVSEANLDKPTFEQRSDAPDGPNGRVTSPYPCGGSAGASLSRLYGGISIDPNTYPGKNTISEAGMLAIGNVADLPLSDRSPLRTPLQQPAPFRSRQC